MSTTRVPKSAAYNEGYLAGVNGKSGVVPQKYGLGSQDANDWGDGWADGKAAR